MLKRLAILGACLLLQACAVVGSEKPLFAPADAAGAATLRPGLWAMPQTDCKDFDPSAPADQWPECANLIIVTALTIGGDEHEKDGTITKREMAYILASGEPRVMQLKTPDDRKADDPAYLYMGVRPTKTDKQGRIIEGRVWLGLCAEPPDAKHMFEKRKVKPLPGLVMEKGDGGCLATEPGPVRAAVKATEGWLEKKDIEDAIITVRWVRDGGR